MNNMSVYLSNVPISSGVLRMLVPLPTRFSILVISPDLKTNRPQYLLEVVKII